MPETDIAKVKCPACTAEAEFQPATVLRDETPELQALFDGTLNRVECPGCGTQFLFETPILYRDDDGRHLIYYLPRALNDNLEDALRQMDEFADVIFAEFDDAERPECRLSTQRHHFLEKIALHHHGFDDRLVEYVKYQLFEHSEGLDPIRHELLFDFGGHEEGQIKFIAFDRETGEAKYGLGFAEEDYRGLEEYFLAGPAMEAQLDGLFKGKYVHVDDIML